MILKEKAVHACRSASKGQKESAERACRFASSLCLLVPAFVLQRVCLRRPELWNCLARQPSIHERTASTESDAAQRAAGPRTGVLGYLWAADMAMQAAPLPFFRFGANAAPLACAAVVLSGGCAASPRPRSNFRPPPMAWKRQRRGSRTLTSFDGL